MDSQLKTVERGTFSKSDALYETEKRIDNYKDKYESAEESFVDGHFGFMRNEKNFLEISMVDSNWGSYIWCESIVSEKIFLWTIKRHRRYELKRADRATTLDCVEKFYEYSPDAFLAHFRSLGAKKEF